MAYTPFLYCNSSLLHDLLLTEKAPFFFFFLSAGVIVLLFLVLFYLFVYFRWKKSKVLLVICLWLSVCRKNYFWISLVYSQ